MERGGRTGSQPVYPGAALSYDLAACLRFYSRLPVPRLPGEGDPHAIPDFRRVPRMLPVAGLVLALPGAVTLLAGWRLGLGPFLAATLAIAVGILITGALHEDGLADVADGFGGGATLTRRLEIMRDSRIGAYGGVALVLSLALRMGALATLLDRVGADAALALILAAILSRTAALAPMVLLPPARADGAGAAVGRPGRDALLLATALALLLTLGGIAAGLPAAGALLMIGLAAAGALAMTALARAKIGGQTGDVIGACQQAAEIVALLGLVAAIPA